MQLLKLTPVAALLVLAFTSCKTKTEDDLIVRSGLPMTAAQETPATTSTATGTIDVVYNKASKTLNYTVKWQGLTGNVVGFHIHGLAAKGFPAGIFQNFSGYPTGTSGTFTGTLYFDEVAAKENDLLHGMYYINIHTAANTAGEIRGQIEFN
jgi:hypothetical protein